VSFTLWNKLPDGFLQMSYKRWAKLDNDVKRLIVELATEQKFKCAHCTRVRKLVVEHDHDPQHGPGDKYTVYNIRGLVCQRCNWHLMLCEKDKNGEYRGFDDVQSYVSDNEWESYIYTYEGRVGALLEALLEEKLGPQNYWRRRLFLNKFDDWREWGGSYPWYWAFDEIKDEKYGKIRTPKQFFKTLVGCMQFIKGELEKNPDFEIPDEFIRLMVRVKPVLDELRPIAEARLLELRSKNSAP
jgi:hypothetical protein